MGEKITSPRRLPLVFVFGSIANAVQGESGRSPFGGQAERYDATTTVTRVVDGDTIDISPSVEGLSRVRLIGMDTPEVYFGTQPYGPEASDFAKRELDARPRFREAMSYTLTFADDGGLERYLEFTGW